MQKYKRALVVSGGSSKVAFAVGVLDRMRHLEFDLLVGTSSGALVLPFVALKKHDKMLAVFREARTEDFYEPIEPLDAGVAAGGLNSAKPLLEKIRENLDDREALSIIDSTSTTLVVNTVRLHDGHLIRWVAGCRLESEQNPPGESGLLRVADAESLRRAVWASCIQPVGMKPGRIVLSNQERFIDGGFRCGAAIAFARHLATDVLAIVTSTSSEVDGSEFYPPSKWDIAGVAEAVLARLVARRVLQNDIREGAAVNGGEFGIVQPTGKLTPDANVFDPAQMKTMVATGQQRADEFLNSHPHWKPVARTPNAEPSGSP